MKKLMYLLLLGLIFACSSKKETVKQETNSIPDMHQANLSLDYWGSYNGTLPCIDCEGIETLLVLTQDQNYTLSRTYLDKSKETIETKEQFVWNEIGNTINLVGVESPNQYFVGKNELFLINREGKRIVGELASIYTLKKK